MPSTITGDHDIAIELSTRLLQNYLEHALVGAHQIQEASVRVAGVGVEALTGPAGQILARLTIKVSHGTLRLDLGQPLTVRRLRVDVNVTVPIALAVAPDGAVRFDPRLAELDASGLTLAWGAGVEADMQQQLADQGLPWNPGFLGLLRDRLLAALRQIQPPPLVIPGVRHDPAAGGFIEAGELRFRALEIGSRAASASGPGRFLLAGTAAPHPGLASALAKKTRNVLGLGQDLALTLSLEALRDGLLCPKLAEVLGTDRDGLCPACGGGGPFSIVDRLGLPLSRCDITAIEVALVPGALRIALHVSAGAWFGSASGSAALSVTFAVVAGELRAQAKVDAVDLEVDSSWLLRIATAGVSEALAELVESAFDDVIVVLLQGLLDPTKPLLAYALPQAIAGQVIVYDGVHVDEDGITLVAHALLQSVMPKFPYVRIEPQYLDSVDTLIGSGTGSGTCLRRGYAFRDVDADLTIALVPVTHDLEPAQTFRWKLAGVAIPPGTATLTLPVVDLGEGPEANDGVTHVETELDAEGRVLTLRCRHQDGNYMIHAVCEVDDGIDVYVDYKAVSIEGQQRRWERAYVRDWLRCKAITLTLEPRRRWPASDPPNWFKDRPVRELLGVLDIGGDEELQAGFTLLDPFAARAFRIVAGEVVQTAASRLLAQANPAAPADLRDAELVRAESRGAGLDPAARRRIRRIAGPLRRDNQ